MIGSLIQGAGWALVIAALGVAYGIPLGPRLLASVGICVVAAAGDVTNLLIRYRRAAKDVRNEVAR